MTSKGYTPFTYINSINTKKPIDSIDNKSYKQYVINKNYSLFKDTIFIVNEVNKFGNLTNQMHYDYLNNMISKKNRFKKWPKKQQSEDIELISKYYNITYQKAYQLSKVFTNDFIEKIKNDSRENKYE